MSSYLISDLLLLCRGVCLGLRSTSSASVFGRGTSMMNMPKGNRPNGTICSPRGRRLSGAKRSGRGGSAGWDSCFWGRKCRLEEFLLVLLLQELFFEVFCFGEILHQNFANLCW